MKKPRKIKDFVSKIDKPIADFIATCDENVAKILQEEADKMKDMRGLHIHL